MLTNLDWMEDWGNLFYTYINIYVISENTVTCCILGGHSAFLFSTFL